VVERGTSCSGNFQETPDMIKTLKTELKAIVQVQESSGIDWKTTIVHESDRKY
jgi:hypothetical protein